MTRIKMKHYKYQNKQTKNLCELALNKTPLPILQFVVSCPKHQVRHFSSHIIEVRREKKNDKRHLEKFTAPCLKNLYTRRDDKFPLFKRDGINLQSSRIHLGGGQRTQHACHENWHACWQNKTKLPFWHVT